MDFLKKFFKEKYYIYVIFIVVLLICCFTVMSKASSRKYSKPVEVKKYAVTKLEENKEPEIIVIETAEENFVISDSKEDEQEDEEDEKIKEEDGNVTYKGITVEVPEVVVAKVNDSEDKEKQVNDSSTSNGAVVTVEDTLEMYENSGNSVGIDVSKWQGNINWSEVKNSGVEFAMIRIGYRGSSVGNIVMDPYFEQNIKGALKNGIKVGVYFFSMATNEEEAIQEAAWTIQNARKYRITYPIVYDFESWGTGRVAGVSNEQIQKNALAFLGYIKSSGYSGMMYGSKNALNSRFSMGSFASYKIWLAHYTENTDYTGRYNMWQYTSKGTVPGISGYTDMNIAYFSYSKDKEAQSPESENNDEENDSNNDTGSLIDNVLGVDD